MSGGHRRWDPLGRARAAGSPVLARVRGRKPQRPTVRSSNGLVILPFGRYFAARADLLTRDGFKTTAAIDGVSPFSGVGDPDADMQHLVHGERVNDRVVTEVCKNLDQRLAQAGADYLVVDNSTALLMHREVNGRLYTILPGEQSDLMDTLWDGPPPAQLGVRVSHDGLTEHLRSLYDDFVECCLSQFGPERIILIRAHCARFWVDERGAVAPTNVDRRDARLLDELDQYFIAKTGCRVVSAALRHVPAAAQWQHSDHRLRKAMEAELVALCTEGSNRRARAPAVVERLPPLEAADHVLSAARHDRRVDPRALRRFFESGEASYDDLLALVYLQQQQPEDPETQALVRECVRLAVSHEVGSHPLADTRRRFDASLTALRAWPWLLVRLPKGDLWRPQAAVPCGAVVFRFLDTGVIQRVVLDRVAVSDAPAVLQGRVEVTPSNLVSLLSSWPLYLERARRGIRTAPTVVLSGAAELIDTCSWLDWAEALENERLVITARQDRGDSPRSVPKAKTDLGFLFEPRARIGTVGGGLMDQVTHIALFDELCRRHDLQLYLDDFRYTWWHSHNGFEASRLAPHLERRRMTRLVSQALIESFRQEVTRTRLPWVYNQSRTWHNFGLHEAVVVTWDYFNSRRLLEMGPPFPVHVYADRDDLDGLFARPPSPVCFFTTQQRIPVAGRSSAAIRRVFSYRHLLSAGLDPDVGRTAALLRRTPHAALHIRRGDYLNAHFDTDGWHSRQDHYIEAMHFLIDSEFGTRDFDLAVFSDDLQFVESHAEDYGIDLVTGTVRFIRGNRHYKSIFDSYLMSLCPVIVGSVGSFAATTSLLADPPSVFIRARPGAVKVEWRR